MMGFHQSSETRAANDDGFTLNLVALALFLLVGASALAVDIGMLWLDRSADQKVADSAAAAGAFELWGGNGQDACQKALAYVAVNAEEIGSIDSTGCASAFTTSCTLGQSHAVTSGRFTITVTHPVANNDGLMTSGVVGATTQGLHADDGDPCERVAVRIAATRTSLFARLFGSAQNTTTVHSVAVLSLEGDSLPLNLLVLDRTGCQSIAVSGNGGVLVDAIIERDSMGNPIGLIPGLAAADSDGSAGCTTNGVLDIDGSHAELRADGPAGCPDQSGTHSVGAYTAGEGCGLIRTVAPGTPGCAPSVNVPACTPGAGGANRPAPEPTALPGRLTRERIDHTFNCYPNYTTPPSGALWATSPLTGNQSINGCTGNNDHIYDLLDDVNASGKPLGHGSWSYWNADLGHSCNVPSSAPPVNHNGNVVVDCSSFTVRTHVRIRGNVVFDGDAGVTASGNLEIVNPPANPGWVVFRDGELNKVGQGSLTFLHTMVYMSNTSEIAMAGGSGSLTWIAPNTGPFNDLALWSDSPSLHKWAGQANLAMEGVFFMPWATAEYTGTSDQNQTNAQWVAWRLHAGGQGKLSIRPSADRSVGFFSPLTNLIR